MRAMLFTVEAVLLCVVAGVSFAGPAVKRISVNGAELAYVEKGSGEPVLLIHGSLGSLTMWSAQVDALGGKYHVIAYSRRFHAPNKPPAPEDPAYSYQLHAEDAAELIRALKLGSVHLVGHSYGGAVAALVALEHPELVRSLMLVEPGMYSMLAQNEASKAILAELSRLRPRVVDMMATGRDAEAIAVLMNYVFKPKTFADVAPQIRKGMLENAPSLRAQIISSAQPPPFACADATEVKIPTLLMEGEKTLVDFRLINDEFERCLPNRQRVRVSGAGHGLIYDDAPAVNNALLQFLAAQGHK